MAVFSSGSGQERPPSREQAVDTWRIWSFLAIFFPFFLSFYFSRCRIMNSFFFQFGKTPILPPVELEKMGYTIAAYPLSLLSASIKAMDAALQRLKTGEPLDDLLEGFEKVQKVVGFRDYDDTAAKYKID